MIAAAASIDPSHLSAIELSIKVSLLATLFCLAPGVLLGIWLARTSSRLRSVVEVLVMVPLVAPPVVTGFLLLIVLREIHTDLLFTFWAATVASALMGLPLLIRTVRASVEAIDPRYGIVAATLGASPIRRLATITIPLAWRGIVSGATLAWARALGEFGATIVVAGNIPDRTRTIPLAVWTAIQTPGAPSTAPLIVAALVLTVAAVAVAELLQRQYLPHGTRGA
jgi:molybdate transport system permease protein